MATSEAHLRGFVNEREEHLARKTVDRRILVTREARLRQKRHDAPAGSPSNR